MSTKNCSSCHKEKPYSEFGKVSSVKSGLNSRCKACVRDKSRTKTELIKKIYRKQRCSSVRRGHKKPDYSCDDLIYWAMSQPVFHELYDKWLESGYEKNLTPSFDRTDDYQGYSLDRLRVVTWHENFKRSHRDRINGVNNKASKSVKQYSIDNVFIKEYFSIMQAGRITGTQSSHITACCKGKRGASGGFKWKY